MVNGSRNSQCTSGYVGVRCELCDYESGYALHQPGDKCSICKPDEGRDSVYLAVGVLCLLVLVVIVAKLGLCPRWLLRVKRVAVIDGKHTGRIGELTGPHSEVDLLNDALRGGQYAPIDPHSAFELFSAAHGVELSKDALQRKWESAKSSAKDKFEQLAQDEEDRYTQLVTKRSNQQHVLLGKIYAVKLRKDGEHDDVDVLVRGVDLQLRTLNAQQAYEARVTKIKIFVQYLQICLRLHGTYRFPLPPLTIEFLSYIKFLEIFDIAQIPMNLDW